MNVTKVEWNEAQPGEYPVLLVGAGFPLGVLDSRLPSTEDLIKKTATDQGADFPLIQHLYNHAPGNDTRLDFVWTNDDHICKVLNVRFAEIADAYRTQYSNRHPMVSMADRLSARREDDWWKRWVLLGVELKRMLAFQYAESKIKLASPLAQRLTTLVKSFSKPVWIAFNYDLVVESVLECCCTARKWRYAFQGLFEPDHWSDTKDAEHIVIKPHGSLNLWFKTEYARFNHSVGFVDSTNRLATCGWDSIGNEQSNSEFRPCIIGYLPDVLKDEANTPGSTADASHDFAKWNLTHAGLTLHRATSIFVFGYSMPLADGWIWNRIVGLPKKDISVYVASGVDSDSIVRRFHNVGFQNAAKLGDGMI